jgi:membrane associated rhomboid family serine protease
MEQDFAYFNPFAIGLSMILIGVFIMQYMQGFPEGMSIDLNNFTYKYAAYGNSQNPVGIFTSMFLHG